jgi:AraC-like DNA-binding protein
MRLNKLELHDGLVSQSGLPNVMRQPHYHDHIELNLIEKGAMTYLLGSHQFAVEAGRMLAFWAAIPHQVTEIAADTRLHWLYIPLPLLLGWNLPMPFVESTLSGLPFIGETQASDLSRFQQWHADLSAQQEELYGIVLLEVEARIKRLARQYSQPGTSLHAPRISSGVHLKQARQMALFIAQNYTDALTVERIARVVSLHPNYAMKVFRDQFHTSMLDYLMRYRVAHAQRLLLTSERQIMDIGLEAGFGSSSRFYAIFKRYCGQSPGQYRRSLQYQT